MAEYTLQDIECINGLSSNPSINDDEPRTPTKVTRPRILWNLLLVTSSYCVSSTGFWGLSNLQSTINAGIGPDSQAVVYGFSALSSLFLPELLIERYGCKRVLVVTAALSIPYLAGNFRLRWDVVMATSALYGLISGPMGTATNVYVDELAVRFMTTLDQSVMNLDFIMACFFGVNTFFVENTQIWGNVISSLVLGYHRNHHFNSSHPHHHGCGFHFKANSSNENLAPPSEGQRMVLVGIYVTTGLVAVLMYLLLDPIRDQDGQGGCSVACERFQASIKHMKNPLQVLLIPLTVYMGVESAFYANEITEAYIACSWGVHHVGFVTVCFGVCGAITALLVGPLVKYFSQMAVILLAACANLSTCIFLFFWQPTPDAPYTYFIVAGVWGMGDAIWWSQVTALYGLMFPDDREAAFSNLYFWSFLGFFLSYSYANYFSVAVKMYILLTFLTTGILGYLIGQIRIRCASRTQYVAIDQDEQ